MKKITLLCFSLLLVNLLFSQQQAIKITNQTSNKEITIKENKRIKIKTTNGEKISGRFKIDGNNSILIKDKRIEFSDIEEIKRNSLLLSIFTSSVLIYAGAITAGFGALIGALVDSNAFWLAVPAAAMIYGGIKSPNLQKKYKKSSNWTFETTTISN